MAELKKTRIAVVGLGYWGPNLLRTFNKLGVLASGFDLNKSVLGNFTTDPAYSGVYFDTDWEKSLGRADLDAVVIATPPNTHYDIASESMLHGKHVFVEKPLTLDVDEATELVKISRVTGKVLMVGHIFLYSPEIIKLKEIIHKPAFGDILYAYSNRLNLGKIQAPANVIEDLAPHDVSVMNYLLEADCINVQATAKAHVLPSSEDVAFINMLYNNDVMVHSHLSWLDPFKVRTIVVVGSKQMVFCDSGKREIRLYNKKVNIDKRSKQSNIDFAHHLMSYAFGDVVMPYIETKEPMMTECVEFLQCIEYNQEPLSNAAMGLNVVKVVDAMQRSARSSGLWTRV